MLKRTLDFSHQLLKDSITIGETVVDATCGNGNDTLLLSQLVGEEGFVLSFDIQVKAIENTKQLLEENKCSNVSLINDTHAKVDEYLNEKNISEIGGAIFNLGYLPRSDKTIITKGESTITAIQNSLNYLKKNGLIVIVVYHGHYGGKEERDQILEYVIQLEQKKYNVLKYGFINQKNAPPFILAIENKL